MSDAKQQSQQWKFSDGARTKLSAALGPEQASAFAALFEVVVPFFPASAEIRRVAQRAARHLEQVLDCLEKDGASDTLRQGTDVSRDEWETWKSIARRVIPEGRPRRGRPVEIDNERAGLLVAFVFKCLNLPAARSPEGAFAAACAIVFEELGLSRPAEWDPRILARYDRAGRLFLVELKRNEEFLKALATPVPDGSDGQRFPAPHLRP